MKFSLILLVICIGLTIGCKKDDEPEEVDPCLSCTYLWGNSWRLVESYNCPTGSSYCPFDDYGGNVDFHFSQEGDFSISIRCSGLINLMNSVGRMEFGGACNLIFNDSIRTLEVCPRNPNEKNTIVLDPQWRITHVNCGIMRLLTDGGRSLTLEKIDWTLVLHNLPLHTYL